MKEKFVWFIIHSLCFKWLSWLIFLFVCLLVSLFSCLLNCILEPICFIIIYCHSKTEHTHTTKAFFICEIIYLSTCLRIWWECVYNCCIQWNVDINNIVYTPIHKNRPKWTNVHWFINDRVVHMFFVYNIKYQTKITKKKVRT